jgi:hypothetical protein
MLFQNNIYRQIALLIAHRPAWANPANAARQCYVHEVGYRSFPTPTAIVKYFATDQAERFHLPKIAFRTFRFSRADLGMYASTST